MSSDTQEWFARYALLPGGLAPDVTLEVTGQHYTRVAPRTEPSPQARRLPGVVMPGLANAHSHVYMRALRGRIHAGARAEWAARELQHKLIAKLTPDNLHRLARATFAEMALAGITTVGEFHVVHHNPDGRPYADANAMGKAIVEAAAEAGIRLTLFDTLFLSGGLGPDGHYRLGAAQIRFGDASAESWVARVSTMPETPMMRLGIGIPSIQCVPRGFLHRALDVAIGGPQARKRGGRLPVHADVSERTEDNDASMGYYGCTPTRLLLDEGFVHPTFTAVHATHVSAQDITVIGRAKAGVAFCPSTEQDTGVGIGPVRSLLDAGARLSLGTDSAFTIDLFEEMRALEMRERVAAGARGQLGLLGLRQATVAHDTVGWPEAGALREGSLADIVAVDLDSVRTAGVDPAQILMTAQAADVREVAVAGRFIVEDGRHVLGDVASLLGGAIHPLFS